MKVILRVLLVSFLATACAGSPIQTQAPGLPTTNAPSLPTVLTATVVMDPPRGTMLFAPPGDAHARLTSSEAMTAFEAVDTDLNLPATVTSHLGLYTAAVGDGTYRYKDRLAWGFTWHECAEPRMEPPPGWVAPCTEWLFLDANTGEMLEATWQS